jgi:hypothetical protein
VHTVLVAFVVFVVVAVALAALLAVLITRKAARALRTGYRSVHAQVSERATTTLTTLQARVLPAGPRQEVAGLRHDLRRSGDATRRVLATASGPPGHLPDWADRLAQATDSLDRQLAGLQREPDTAQVSAALTALRPVVREATTAGAELRSAIRQADSMPETADLTALTGGIRDEIHAVSAGIAYLRSQTAVPLPLAASPSSSCFRTGRSD